jgi:hypothetical protein
MGVYRQVVPRYKQLHAPAALQQRVDAVGKEQVLVHVCGLHVVAHFPLVQMPETQSAGAAQIFPLAHLVAQLPPQSTSDSLPFLAASVHVAAAQRPPVHAPPVQSVWTVQSNPFAQSAHVPPPQSTSVSKPFFTASLQDVAMHFPPEHSLLVQSARTPHTLPFAQREQLPPQSTSVSAPFLTTSAHVGHWQ